MEVALDLGGSLGRRGRREEVQAFSLVRMLGIQGRSHLGLGADVVSFFFFFLREAQGCLVIQQVAGFQL